MNYLDVLYRAFLEYRDTTKSDRECLQQRGTVAKSDVENDSVAVERVVCEIDTDWIDAIEEGLTYIEKALAQERQFIRADGEIVPIEKVKRVSRDSVEHLSRHSNLITKEQDGPDLVPEKIYTVERLNDYAVYENRFLYMLLSYLNDFISDRYTRILDLTNTYHGTASFSKTINTRQREIKFELKLDEKQRDDPIMRELNPCKNTLERINMLLKTVNHFLATPLMEEVAKAAKLKPPVTKTNVLKMDKDFKGAMALYEFISSYDRDGFTIKRSNKRMMFTEFVADEFAELYMLTSFLTYEYGMGIKSYLKSHYDAEEKKRKLLFEQQRLEQIKRLRRHIAESGESPEGYMLLLEKQIKNYEGIYTKLDAAENEIKRLSEENFELTRQAAALRDEITDAAAERERLEQKYDIDMQALRDEHKKNMDAAEIVWQMRLDDAAAKHAEELAEVNTEHARQLSDERERRRAEVKSVTDKYEDELSERELKIEQLDESLEKEKQARKSERDALIAEHAKELSERDALVAQKEQAVLDIREENRLLEDLKRLSDGRLNALRHEYGLMTDADDFTTENAFNEIEAQYSAFRRFFKGEWKKTKKKIRDELLKAHSSHKNSSDDDDDGDEAPAKTKRPDGERDEKKRSGGAAENDGGATGANGAADTVIVPDAKASVSTLDLLDPDDE